MFWISCADHAVSTLPTCVSRIAEDSVMLFMSQHVIVVTRSFIDYESIDPGAVSHVDSVAIA